VYSIRRTKSPVCNVDSLAEPETLMEILQTLVRENPRLSCDCGYRRSAQDLLAILGDSAKRRSTLALLRLFSRLAPCSPSNSSVPKPMGGPLNSAMWPHHILAAIPSTGCFC